MNSRQAFKKSGKNAFKRNWKVCVIVCFLYTFLVGGTIVGSYKQYHGVNYQESYEVIKNVDINAFRGSDNNSEVVNDFIVGINQNELKDNKLIASTRKGVIGSFLNNVSQSGSYLFGFLNALNQYFFHDRVWASAIIIIGTVISFFYWLFVSKVLEVGYARFFLENRKFTKTKQNKLIYPYKIGKVAYSAYTMFIKNFYILLWSFTIVGAFIKHYSYAMVPYILSENQTLKPKEVLKLSEEMMKGHKWELFILDLSFIGWKILGFLTLNISNLFFTIPYQRATYAEVYMALRCDAKEKEILHAKELNDKNLEGDIVEEEYPISSYPENYEKTRRWMRFNYNRKYSIPDYILMFFIFSFVGYLWEVLLHLFRSGVFVNRGALYGPWLPIYGSGCILLLVFLKKYRDNPILYFFIAMLLCGIVEYATSVYLELVHHMAWWNYTGYFLNINGRVCLEGLLLFAAGGTFITYVVAPVLGNILDKVPRKLKVILSVILVVLIAFDFYASSVRPNQGAGVTTEITDSKIDKIKESHS